MCGTFRTRISMDLPTFVQQYGLVAVAAGAILEGETVLLLAGAAAHLGLLALPWVIVVAAVAAFIGDNCFFFVGRRFGPQLTQRHPRLAAVMPRVDALVARWGWFAVVVLRFAYGLRAAGPIALGATRMPLAEFAAANALGAALWATLIASLGYVAGRAVEPLLARIVSAEKLLLVLIVVLALAGVALRYWLKRRVTARTR